MKHLITLIALSFINTAISQENGYPITCTLESYIHTNTIGENGGFPLILRDTIETEFPQRGYKYYKFTSEGKMLELQEAEYRNMILSPNEAIKRKYFALYVNSIEYFYGNELAITLQQPGRTQLRARSYAVKDKAEAELKGEFKEDVLEGKSTSHSFNVNCYRKES
ncbi:MAG: hypothetical protein R3A80_04135 [Bdellovibrionota bacterium]